MIELMRWFNPLFFCFLTLAVFISGTSFGLKVLDLPPVYKSIFQPLEGKLDGIVKRNGGNFRAVLSYSVAGGTRYVEIVDPDFLSFYEKLYQYAGGEIQKVSVKVVYKGRTLPYNPFYQIWDDYGVRLITFSALRPGCVPPVLTLKAERVRGIRIIIPFDEVKKSFFPAGGKYRYPTHYCY